ASGALSHAKQGKAERIFCGHTHVPSQAKMHGIEYYNAGAWVDLRCTYITIDEEGVAIHEYIPQSPDNRDSSEERIEAAAAPFRVTLPAGLPGHAACESIRC